MNITLPAQYKKFSPRVDKSCLLSFETRELTGDEVKYLHETMNEEGWLLFSPNEHQLKDIPKEEAQVDGKSPSKQLMDRMYVYYMETNGDKSGFRYWYERQMDKLGQSYLDKLSE